MKWSAIVTFVASAALASGALAEGVLLTDDKTLSGDMMLAGVSHTVEIDVDVVNYGSGTTHKAYIINQFSGGTPTSVAPIALSGVRITGCAFVDSSDNPVGKSFKIKYAAASSAKINGTAIWAGSAPRVLCNAKKGNGSQPPENYATIILE